MNRKNFIVLFATFLIGAWVNPAAAAKPPFGSTKTFAGTYLLGSSSLSEYDYYNTLYPGIASPFLFTFYNNGAVDVLDIDAGGSISGIYTRVNNRLILIDAVAPGPYFSTIQYRLERTQGQWWGEVFFDGYLYGHFRGSF